MTPSKDVDENEVEELDNVSLLSLLYGCNYPIINAILRMLIRCLNLKMMNRKNKPFCKVVQY